MPKNTPDRKALPLDGVTVVDFSRLLPGPWCAQLFADLGAAVIKVEQPGLGDFSRHNPPRYRNSSVYFNSVNAGKRGIALDLSRPEGLEVARRLFARTDVVLESFRPGVTRKLGIDYPGARQVNARLIYCSISGYGQTGPLARVPGHDLVIQSMTGLMGGALPPGRPPDMPGFQAADYAAAAMAAIGVLAALMRRERTGEGCYIDLSMFDSLFYMCNIVLTGAMARRAGYHGRPSMEVSGGNPRYANYLCRDGKPVAVSLLEARQWAQFCRVIGQEELIFADEGPEDRHSAHGERAALFREAIAGYCASVDRDVLIGTMEEHQIPICAIFTPDEALAAANVEARGLLATCNHPEEGPIPRLVSPLARTGLTGETLAAAPALGGDNESVLTELGYSEAERRQLRKSGIIDGG